MIQKSRHDIDAAQIERGQNDVPVLAANQTIPKNVIPDPRDQRGYVIVSGSVHFM